MAMILFHTCFAAGLWRSSRRYWACMRWLTSTSATTTSAMQAPPPSPTLAPSAPRRLISFRPICEC
eukprot:2746428-Rhodomonas_salina.2